MCEGHTQLCRRVPEDWVTRTDRTGTLIVGELLPCRCFDPASPGNLWPKATVVIKEGTIVAQKGEPGRHDAGDAAPFSLGLQDDSKLHPAMLTAGVLSVVALVAMIIMPPARSPSPGWTFVLAALALWLSVAIGVRMVRDRFGLGRRHQSEHRAGR